MTVRFSPRALADLEGIRDYLVPLNSQGAERVRVAIAKAVDRCAANPRIGTKADEPGLFRWPLRKYQYTIFYRVLPAGDGIEIARIVHGARVKKLGILPEDR